MQWQHADVVAEEGADEMHEGGSHGQRCTARHAGRALLERVRDEDALVEGAMKGVAKGALSRDAPQDVQQGLRHQDSLRLLTTLDDDAMKRRWRD